MLGPCVVARRACGGGAYELAGVVLSAFVCVQEITDRRFANRSESRFSVCHLKFTHSFIHSLGGYFLTSFLPRMRISDSALGLMLLLGAQR